MSFLKYIKRNTWLLMLLVSFVMYEALWSLIEFQLGELYFEKTFCVTLRNVCCSRPLCFS